MIATLILLGLIGLPIFVFVKAIVYAKHHSAHGQRERMIKALEKRDRQ